MGKIIENFVFQAIFMPSSEHSAESPTLPLKIVPIANMAVGHGLLRHFMEMVTAFRELPQMDKDFLLTNRVHTMMVKIGLISLKNAFPLKMILAVFADRKEMIRQLNLPSEQFDQLRGIFTVGSRPLYLEETALLMACALTSGRPSEPIEKLHLWLWKSAQEQILDRNGDDENIDPVQICLNLIQIMVNFH